MVNYHPPVLPQYKIKSNPVIQIFGVFFRFPLKLLSPQVWTNATVFYFDRTRTGVVSPGSYSGWAAIVHSALIWSSPVNCGLTLAINTVWRYQLSFKLTGFASHLFFCHKPLKTPCNQRRFRSARAVITPPLHVPLQFSFHWHPYSGTQPFVI